MKSKKSETKKKKKNLSKVKLEKKKKGINQEISNKCINFLLIKLYEQRIKNAVNPICADNHS